MMNQEELKALVADEINNAIGYLESDTVQARADAMSY